MAYIFCLDGIILPVSPAKFKMKCGNQNKTMTLMDQGEINFLKAPGLMEFSFEVLIPRVEYPFAHYEHGFRPAQDYMEDFKKLKEAKNPFYFEIARRSPSHKIFKQDKFLVSLEEYTITEDADNGFDLMVEIKLKQYRKIETQKANVTVQNGETVVTIEKERPSNRVIPKSYTVVKGDTLWMICQVNLGKGDRCREIAKLNNLPNANLIYPGQVIRFE